MDSSKNSNSSFSGSSSPAPADEDDTDAELGENTVYTALLRMLIEMRKEEAELYADGD